MFNIFNVMIFFAFRKILIRIRALTESIQMPITIITLVALAAMPRPPSTFKISRISTARVP